MYIKVIGDDYLKFIEPTLIVLPKNYQLARKFLNDDLLFRNMNIKVITECMMDHDRDGLIGYLIDIFEIGERSTIWMNTPKILW